MNIEYREESESDETDTSRRHVLRSLGGVLITGLSSMIGGNSHQDIFYSHKSSTQTTNQQTIPSTTHIRRAQRLAYLSLPGLSVTSLIANVPYLLNTSTEMMPVILMDTHDYHRFQLLTQTNSSDPSLNVKNQNIALALDHLHRQGVIQLFDYADFYPRAIQRDMLQRNSALVDELSAGNQQRIAVQAADGRIDYHRDDYQETFREQLGETPDTFRGGRRAEQARRRTLNRGSGDPLEWNEQILNQYAAALHIRQYADDILDLNVHGIIGEGESMILTEILDRTELRDGSHIAEMEPSEHIMALTSEELAPTRAALDMIGELAAEMASVQRIEWVVLGPTLAIPQYHDLFDMNIVEDQLSDELDIDTLTDEVIQAVDILENRTEDGPSLHKLTYAAEWAKESGVSLHAAGQSQNRGLTEMFNYTTTLAQYSRELWSVVKQGEVSQAAALVATGIISNPSRSANRETIYHQGNRVSEHLSPSVVDEAQLGAFRRRQTVWEDSSDWYETTARAR